jgi:VWFA-related protein
MAMRSRRPFAIAWFLHAAILGLWMACAALPAQAQTGADTPVFQSESLLMQVELNAFDRRGKPVRGIRAEDLRLSENGKPRRIAFLRWVCGQDDAGCAHPSAGSTKPDSPPPLSPPPLSPADSRELIYIYVKFEVAPTELTRAIAAVRQFVEQQFRPEFRLSIDGLPFTGDRVLLLDLLQQMEASGGTAWVNGQRVSLAGDTSQALLRSLGPLPEASLPREPAGALPPNPEGPLPADRQTDPRQTDPSLAVANLAIARERIMAQHRSLAGYVRLAEILGRLAGPKYVLLFRPGIALSGGADGQLEEDLRRLRSAAFRNRVRFYPMDTRGLTTIIAGGDATSGEPLSQSGFGQSVIQQFAADRDLLQGLDLIARNSGGVSHSWSNDLSVAMRSIADRHREYYVVGYYVPGEPQASSDAAPEAVRVQISASLPGLTLQYQDLYYRDLPFARMSEGARQRSFEYALDGIANPAAFPLRVNVDFLHYRPGETGAHLALGISPDALPPSRQGPVELQIGVAAWPEHRGKSYRRVFRVPVAPHPPQDQLPGNLLQAPLRLDLSPGSWTLRCVVRNETTGATAVAETQLAVPDLDAESSPSSLFVTRFGTRPTSAPAATQQSTELAPGAVPTAFPELGLAFAGWTLLPDASNHFRRQQLLYVGLELRNPNAKDLESRAAVQLYFQRGSQFFPPPVIRNAVVHRDPESGAVRYAYEIDLSAFPPGNYRVIAILPRPEERHPPALGRTVTLTD